MHLQKVPRRRVLLVSHDKRLKRQVQAGLAASGLTTTLLTATHNDQKNIRALAKPPPDVIVLDDNISAYEGPTLLETLHQSSPQALIVYIASQHTAELERTVRQLGVLYYTEKPPDDRLLHRVLVSALQQPIRKGRLVADGHRLTAGLSP
jgi:DNA-binding NtrC family response regulator